MKRTRVLWYEMPNRYAYILLRLFTSFIIKVYGELFICTWS
jgi:hypothetical protein